MKRVLNSIFDYLGYEVRKKKSNFSRVLYETYTYQTLQEKRFYNIGAGSFKHPYWTNIDFSTKYYNTIQNDFINYNLVEMKPLPIQDNVAEIVYSSHTIEHVSDEAAANMFKESYRILKKGGGIRITTPDALLEYKAYSRKDIRYWYWVEQYSKHGTWEKLYKIPLSKASIHQLFLHHFASQLSEIDVDDSISKKYSDTEISDHFMQNPNVSSLDYFTKQCKFNVEHPGNHINWWTHEKLISFLKKAGFIAPFISGFGQSTFPPLRDTLFFDNTHPSISLYVEAIKVSQ